MAPIERYKSSQTLRPISTVARLPGLGSTLAQLPLGGLGRRGSARSEHSNSHAANGAKLAVCTDPNEMESCQHFLLYLNNATHDQSRPEVEALYAEIDEALDGGVHVLLAHEMVGLGGQEKRNGCEFSTFFACADGATPSALLQRGIYSEIAVPLKGGAMRDVSMALLNLVLGVAKEQQTKIMNELKLKRSPSKGAFGEISLFASKARRAAADMANIALSKSGRLSLPAMRSKCELPIKKREALAPSAEARASSAEAQAVSVTSKGLQLTSLSIRVDDPFADDGSVARLGPDSIEVDVEEG